jgi:hypothetical protein
MTEFYINNTKKLTTTIKEHISSFIMKTYPSLNYDMSKKKDGTLDPNKIVIETNDNDTITLKYETQFVYFKCIIYLNNFIIQNKLKCFKVNIDYKYKMILSLYNSIEKPNDKITVKKVFGEVILKENYKSEQEYDDAMKKYYDELNKHEKVIHGYKTTDDFKNLENLIELIKKIK